MQVTEHDGSVWVSSDEHQEALDRLALLENEQHWQLQVNRWMQACFGEALMADRQMRGDRFLEEVLEALQAMGYDQARVAKLVSYVYGRPSGEITQEIGGVMVTLAAFCSSLDIKMMPCATAELARCYLNIEKIRAKQAIKTAILGDSPLPQNPS